MGLTKTSDGRYLVGLGIEDSDTYKGSQGYRDLVIQLTADGATDSSFEKLNYLRDYAIYHSGQGNPVMPPSVSVWISNNGTTTAVEADDISYTDGVYTICGIKYENGAWDFTNAGQGGGGGSSLPEVTSEDNGDVLSVVNGEWAKAPAPSSLPPYTSADLGKVLTVGDGVEPKWEENRGLFVVNIGGTPHAPTADATFDQITTAISKGKLPVAVAGGGSMILPCISQSATEYAFSLPSFTISGTSIVSIASYLVKIADDDTVTMIYGGRMFS